MSREELPHRSRDTLLAHGTRRAAVGTVNADEQEQAQRLGTLEELVAERLAREAARIAEERAREIC